MKKLFAILLFISAVFGAPATQTPAQTPQNQPHPATQPAQNQPAQNQPAQNQPAPLDWTQLDADAAQLRHIRALNVSRVYSPNPTAFHILYALDERLVTGAIFRWNAFERAFITPRLLDAPLVGGFYGQGVTPNFEVLASLRPQLVLMSAFARGSKEVRIFGDLGAEVMLLDIETLEDYIAAIHRLGFALGRDERAAELIVSAQNSLAFATALRERLATSGAKSPRVYYAQGADGLQTECAGSYHAVLIELVGGQIALNCDARQSKSSRGFGRVSVSFEEVVAMQPDVVLVYEREFWRRLQTDPKWQLVRAVREGRVHMIPRGPFSWFDRPPSFMRFLGVRWLAGLLYPDIYAELGGRDIAVEAREFYKLWLGVDLTDELLQKVMFADF